MGPNKQIFNSFAEFYPFYLSQHQDTVSRRLHFAGLVIALLWLVVVVLYGLNSWYLCLSAALGYGFGFIGHFVFEKNKPATFKYPLYSFLSDFKMMADIFAGKIKL
jgi:hypothetical protein